MGKRIFLFLVVNIFVVLTLSVIAHAFGVGQYIGQYGLDYKSLAIFCGIWGMGGAFISLAISRIMAKMAYGVQVVDPNTSDPELSWLVQTVHQAARQAGLPAMPEVGVYDSPELNAFATGPTASRSLVAVSTGLLHNMDRDEVEGVIGHEIAHVANGDMVTMTLLQGVVNAFAMFLARIVAYAITRGEKSRSTQFMLVWLFEVVFMLAGSLVVAWFSRQREYRADAGGARIAGRERMVAALEKLRRGMGIVDDQAPAQLAAFKISSAKGGFLRLFSTHPPLEERIARLRAA